MPLKSIPKRILSKIKIRIKLPVLLLSFCLLVVAVLIGSQMNLKIEGYGETLFSTDNLVAQWNFNEISGIIANNDAEGISCGGTPSNCDGTLTNFENTNGQDVVTSSGWTDINKKWGAGALMFDGNNDYITVPDNDSLDLTTAATIDTWIYKRENGDYQAFVTKSGSTQYQLLSYSTTSKIVFRWAEDSDTIISNADVPLDTWTNVVATFDGSFVKLYINGQLDNSVANTTIGTPNSSPLLIGNIQDSARFLVGYIDSTKIYNRALTAGEIFRNYAPAVDESPVADWIGSGTQNDENYGTSVSAGDINGDTFDDVIVGVQYYNNGSNVVGAAFVYYGSDNSDYTGFLADTPDLILEGNQTDSLFGRSVAGVGDVNGDTYDDVVVGAPYYNNGEYKEGQAYLYYGSAGGLISTPNLIGESNYVNALYGWSVAGAGDVNGDGWDDVIIGAHLYDNGVGQGRAYLYYGSASGLSLLTPDWTGISTQPGDEQFGVSVAGAGDVNGDGFDDVIIGAWRYKNNLKGGIVYVYYGSGAGLAEYDNWDWAEEAKQGNSHFGYSVAGAGDVNCDGYDDVIIGQPNYDGGDGDPSPEYIDNGLALVYYGSQWGLGSADWVGELATPVNNALYGYSVAGAGNVNGDTAGGYSCDDVIVGSRYYKNGELDEGGAFVYHGSSSGLEATASWTGESNSVSAQYGTSVAAGDINNDGYSDVLIGAPGYYLAYPFEGRAYMYLGSAETTPPPPANDLKINATTINVGDSLEVDNTYATTEAEGYANEINHSVWYKFSPTEDISYTVDLCDSALTSTKLFVFIQLPDEQQGNYLDLDRIADSTENSEVCTTQSAITFTGDSTKTYYFEVGTFGDYPFGEITVHLSETPVVTPTPPPSPTPTPGFGSSVNIPSDYINIGLPEGMVMLPDGNIWYVDNMNYRLVKYNPTTKTILRTVGRLGDNEGEFNWQILSITRDNDGYLYLLTTDGIVYKMDSNGGFMVKYMLSGLGDPWGITYDSFTDTILIANRLGYNIEKYSKNLVFIDSFGGEGTGDGQFGIAWQQDGDSEVGPSAITTDADGKIYVSDEYNARIQVFNSDYSFIREIKGPWTKIEDEHGDGTTGFTSARGIVILSDGTIVVCNNDWLYSTVEQFTPEGVHIGSFGGYGLDVWNMKAPKFVVRDSSDNIYVADTGDIGIKAITKYESDGTYVSTIRNNYFSDGRFYNPSSPIYDGDGNMYIMDGDVETRRIQKFSSGGTYIATVIPTGVLGGAAYNHVFGPDGRMYVSSRFGIQVFDEASNTSWTDNVILFIGEDGSRGSEPGQFSDAADMVFDATGNLYVADSENHRVQKLILNEFGHYVYDANNGSIQFGGGWLGGEDTFETGEFATPVDIVFDSTYEHLFVSDHRSLKRFTPAGVYEADIGVAHTEFELADSLGIDSNDNLYLSDIWGKKILVFDSVTSELINTFGLYGGGQMQFDNAAKVTFNPDGAMVIGDSNGRIQAVTVGYRILNLIPSANVIRLDDGYVGQSLSDQSWTPSQEDPLTAIPARLMFGDYVVADFTVNLTEDRDWATVNVLTLVLDSKSLIVNLTSSTPGIIGNHSLYLTRYANQTTVTVCPSATQWSELHAECTNEVLLTLGGENLYPLTAIENLNGVDYWKIDGLSGTGAFSTLFETGFTLQDLMTRQMVGVGSDHDILFGTTYDITHSGDTITLTFAPEWDLSTILIGDLALLKGSTNLTLVSALEDSAAHDTWGVSIDNDNKTITFTAPTDTDADQYIEADSTIAVLISNVHLINPGIAASYEISMRILTDNGEDQFSESGSVNVPIVDSDTVDIKGYVNAYIHFDIDTGTGEEPSLSITPIDCGFSDCLIHENGTTGENYTVDMGELKSTYVNKSNDAEVMHTDGNLGIVNSIYFDLTTNAQTGAVITVSSASEGLQGPNSKIESVTDGEGIGLNSGLYGFNLPVASAQLHGTINTNSSCDEVDVYCGPGSISAPQEVFNTNERPVDGARVRMDLAAAAAYTNTPGLYTDTLTFVATATF